MNTYTVTATRDGDWWAVVADLGHREVASQARRFNACEGMIREAIALVLDVEEDDFDVDIIPDLGDLEQFVRPARVARTVMRDRERELAALTAVAVAELRSSGFTTREVAELLGVAASRVAQIDKGTPSEADYALALASRSG